MSMNKYGVVLEPKSDVPNEKEAGTRGWYCPRCHKRTSKAGLCEAHGSKPFETEPSKDSSQR